MAGTGDRTADGGAGKREQGVAISFLGLALIVAALLVVFFTPAAFRIGRQGAFIALIVALAVVGLGLVFIGRSRRRAAM
jgi:Na+-driven multidrug efflux pump